MKKKQEALLGRTLGFAVKNIPAYMHLEGVIKELRPFEALLCFPVIDKKFLQDNFELLVPHKLETQNFYVSTTGGTSGNQLKIVNDNNSHYRETAFIHDMWRQKIGYNTSHKKATFRGVLFSNIDFKERFWQTNPIYNELQFSPFHMNTENLEKYVARLIKYGPAYLHGYPSAIGTVAKFINSSYKQNPLSKLRGVLLGSESLSEKQHSEIAKWLGTEVFTWYGQSERIILAEKCRQKFIYSANPLYGFTEIIDPTDTQQNNTITGELVGTSFYNFAMPLIRYRTGDLAEYITAPCNCCWCDTKITNIQGRWLQDYIVGHNGSKITSTALNMHGTIFENVVRYQYMQNKPGTVSINLMVNQHFDETDFQKIYSVYNDKLMNAINFQLKIVEDIPLTPRGKVKLIKRI